MSFLKAKLDDFDDRGFDLVRRHKLITTSISSHDVARELSDDKQRIWRTADAASHNDAVARAENFFALVAKTA